MDVTQEAPDLAANAALGLPTFTGGGGLGPDIIPTAVHGSINSPTSPADVKQDYNDVAERNNSGKPRQKRNKPTLSCLECVERKGRCIAFHIKTCADFLLVDQV